MNLCVYPKIQGRRGKPDLQIEVTLDQDTLCLILNQDQLLPKAYPINNNQAQLLIAYEHVGKGKGRIDWTIREDQECFIEVSERRDA